MNCICIDYVGYIKKEINYKKKNGKFFKISGRKF